MKKLLLTTAGELGDALEFYIKNFENPSTTAQWEKFLAWMEKRGGIEEIGEVPDSMSASYLAGSLRDEGLNARTLKKGDKNAD